jgi:tripartite-type tricarboxylate transporter receptor subunit TctC
VARGADPVANTPEQFGAYLKEDIARWARLAQSTSIKVD